MSNSEFEQAYAAVRSKVLSVLGNHAEDVFQEVAHRASTKLEQFETEEQLLAYIWSGTAQELRLSMHRAGQRIATLREHHYLNIHQSDKPVDSLVIRQAFEQACEGLTENEKEAVWEVLYDGATVRETGLPKSTVHRLAKQIKEQIAA